MADHARAYDAVPIHEHRERQFLDVIETTDRLPRIDQRGEREAERPGNGLGAARVTVEIDAENRGAVAAALCRTAC